MTAFRIGDQVFWWKRIGRGIDFPYRAEVVMVGVKRITIAVEDPDDADDRFIRHVAADRLQPVAAYFQKAEGQGPTNGGLAESWGQFTRYLEIGPDLRAIRHVDEFANGDLLSYDRVHWIDDFGMLADARINRNQKRGHWGESEEIYAAEFERVWTTARASPTWSQQAASAQMSIRGAAPVWLMNKGWHPSRTARRV